MSRVLTLARKELRSSFQSPLASIFLGIFLAAALAWFFTGARFFARNIADVRPLFEALPLLLILLVSAITMRSWAEEARTGTLEVLLTLPVPSWELVLGKFLAGLALIAIALALTLPVPLVVSHLGDLDWGPVAGGYLASLLLGGAYLAIGLCVSARTDNQVVALMTTLVIGGALYLVGTDGFTAFFGRDVAGFLQAIGTGSRFASVERGVVDLRDLVYYVGLTAFFLALNVYFLEARRLDADAAAGSARQRAARAAVALLALNVVACDTWLAPVAAARADLTEDGAYSVSETTRRTLAELAEPVTLRAFFSQRTHPLLAPLVPRVEDMLAEYRVHGGDLVEVSVEDPTSDPDLEQELAEQYGIRSVPFQVADRNEIAVVNAYFHILVEQGDRHEVLDFDDLIEVRADQGDVEVRLKNLEYDLTRTIRRVSQDFTSLEALLARLPEGSRLALYATPESIPEPFQETLDLLRKLGASLEEKSGGRLSFEELDPSRDPELADRLLQEHAIRPLATDLFAQDTFYLHVVLQAGDRAEALQPTVADPTEGELRSALEAALRRVLPGQLRRIGILTEDPEPTPPQPGLPPEFQPPQRHEDYRLLSQVLAEETEVEDVDLEDGRVPDDLDVLIVGRTGPLTDKERWALDQYLMRGGRIIALAGRWRIDAGPGGLSATREDDALAGLLAGWGVKVGEEMVLDPRNDPFPIPVQEQRGPFAVQRIELLPYPYFPDVRADGFLQGHPALAGLSNVTVPWASPLEVDPPEGVVAQVLLRSSEGAWLDGSGRIVPDFGRFPEAGFGPTGPQGSHVLAVALTGTFPGTWAGKDPPEGLEVVAEPIAASLPDARLVVIGSGEIVSDLMMQVARQLTGEAHRGNIQFLLNLVDWATEDTDLLAIRTSGAFARTLRPMTDEERLRWEWTTYGTVLGAWLLVVILPRRRKVVHEELLAASAGTKDREVAR